MTAFDIFLKNNKEWVHQADVECVRLVCKMARKELPLPRNVSLRRAVSHGLQYFQAVFGNAVHIEHVAHHVCHLRLIFRFYAA